MPDRFIPIGRTHYRALHVLHAAEVIKGGICTYLRLIIERQRLLYGPEHVAAVVPMEQAPELQAAAGVAILGFRESRHRLLNGVRLALAVLGQIRRQRPDIVHLHSTFAGALLRPLLALRYPRLPVLYCPHGWAFFRDQSRLARSLTRALERICARWCDGIVCVSRHERRAAMRVGIDAQKLHVIPNSLSRSRPAAAFDIRWPPGARRLLFVGRFDRQKGIDVLFEALTSLGDAAFAYVIGDSLHTRLADLPANARCVGWKSGAELEAYYASTDVVVMPSRWEGLPLVGLEAMRAGRPIIASDVGGLSELVDHGNTGLLVPPDDAEALADAICTATDASLLQMGIQAAERFFSRWTGESSHAALAALYRCSVETSNRAKIESWYSDFAGSY
ncbi:MAG: glycosyltransferase family 4 protein [Steroidobacteraceae bacterium]